MKCIHKYIIIIYSHHSLYLGEGVVPPPSVVCACVVIHSIVKILITRARTPKTRRRCDGCVGGRVQEPPGEGLDSTVGVEIRRHGRLLLRSAAARRIAPRAENRFPPPPDDSYIYVMVSHYVLHIYYICAWTPTFGRCNYSTCVLFYRPSRPPRPTINPAALHFCTAPPPGPSYEVPPPACIHRNH